MMRMRQFSLARLVKKHLANDRVSVLRTFSTDALDKPTPDAKLEASQIASSQQNLVTIKDAISLPPSDTPILIKVCLRSKYYLHITTSTVSN